MTIPFLKQRRASSRQQMQIREVKDNILILASNEYRQIIETSSINFELKSEEEQDVIIDSFQNFLNSLPSPIQILVRVRELDIDKYIEEVAKTKEKEAIPAYIHQIDGYCRFVRKLVEGNKILSRRFYIVVPFAPTDHKRDWKLIKEHLQLETDIITKGLERLQMRATVLTGIEILNLFYSFYSTETIKTQVLNRDALNVLLKNNYV
jgi:type IV secretory pathway VirB4 component